MKNLSSYILQNPTTGSYDFITRNPQKPVEFDVEHFGKKSKVINKKSAKNYIKIGENKNEKY